MSQTSQKKNLRLRPLKISLVLLVIVFVAIILNRVPTTRSFLDTKTMEDLSETENFYYFSGLVDVLEEKLDDELSERGVPDSDYEHLSEYFSEDELYLIETRVALAMELDENWVLVDSGEVEELKNALGLEKDFELFEYTKEDSAPTEYKNLADLLSQFYQTLNTVEDYDIVEEEL